MSSFNQCVFVGNLARDLDVKQLASGETVANSAIAVNGYKEGEVAFIPFTVWGKLADACDGVLRKGSKCLISGRFKQNNWESKTGEKRSRLELVANTVQFLDPRGTVSGGEPQFADDPSNAPVSDDSLPF